MATKVSTTKFSSLARERSRSPHARWQLQILVKIPFEKTINLEVKSSDTIGSLKAAIQAKNGIPYDQQVLVLDDGCEQLELKEGHTLFYYDLPDENESTVVLWRSAWQIFVKTPRDKTITIDIDGETDEYVWDVKKKIQDKEGIAFEHHRLFWYGTELIDNWCKLSEYCIDDGDTLEVLQDPLAWRT